MTLLVVNVNERLLERFKKFAVNKHGKIYGVLKPEIELALEHHLNEQEKRQLKRRQL